jgi:hypothetical protein
MGVRMSKTISFVASDELAEYLEREAQERMTTVSSTAQMLLAEKVREMGGVSEGSKTASGGSEGDVFDRNPEKWYRPDGKYNLAVRLPNGETKYYKTRDGAAKRLRRHYE